MLIEYFSQLPVVAQLFEPLTVKLQERIKTTARLDERSESHGDIALH